MRIFQRSALYETFNSSTEKVQQMLLTEKKKLKRIKISRAKSYLLRKLELESNNQTIKCHKIPNIIDKALRFKRSKSKFS